jgi:hypothetical protein
VIGFSRSRALPYSKSRTARLSPAGPDLANERDDVESRLVRVGLLHAADYLLHLARGGKALSHEVAGKLL